MAEAKRRTIEIDGQEYYQYYCSNCDEWYEPRNPRKPDFPEHCKGCNTKLNFEGDDRDVKGKY